MPLPTKRLTRHRKGNRRSHHALTVTQTVTSKDTGKPSLPHMASATADGAYFYKGRKIVTKKSAAAIKRTTRKKSS